MRKSTLGLLGWLLFSFSLLPAQSGQELDSLLNVIEQVEVKDSFYLNACIRASRLALSDPKSGLAIQLSKEAMHVSDSLGNIPKLAYACNAAGNAYKVAGLFEKAIEHYSQSLHYFQELDNKAWEANLHSNIAGVFLNKGDLQQAKKELNLALGIRTEIGYFQGISGLYNTFGNLYDLLDEPQKSLEFYQLALDSSANEPLFNRSLFLGNLGNVYGRLHDFKRSRQYNLQALAIHQQMGWKVEASRDHCNIAESFYLQKRLDSAIYYAEKGFELAAQVDYYTVMAITANILMHSNKESGRTESGLSWAMKLVEANDSLHAHEIRGKGNEMEVAYKLEQQEREAEFEKEAAILQKNASIKRQTILNISFGIGLLFLAGLGLLLGRRNKERKQANALLEQKVADRTLELQEANQLLSVEVEAKEKARKTLHEFLHRSSHDLKGPLSSIIGLLELAKKEDDPQKVLSHLTLKAHQAEAVLQQLIDKVEIDEHVAKPQLIDLTALIESLLLELGGRPGFANVEWVLGFDQDLLILADPMLLRIALRQILVNAIDFRSGSPKVELLANSEEAGQSWEIQINDNGIGIPQEQQAQAWEMFVRIAKRSIGAGLGLYLVKQIGLREGWQTIMDSEPGRGTSITLRSGTK